jgi:sialate O-acetylesterase
MVLPQGVPVPIWGSGAPGGDTVRVSFDGQSVTAQSDWAGRWMVVLAPMKAGGPYQMLIEVGGRGAVIPSSAANSRGGAELNDVVVGQVWVMPPRSAAMASATKNASKENAGTRSGWIRVYKIRGRATDDAQPVAGQWTVALPGSVNNISGASYSFGEDQYEQFHAPIGVIESPNGTAEP